MDGSAASDVSRATPDADDAAAPAGDPFDALGDPNRRAIVELLGRGERSVQEIADVLPISRPAVSRHLRLLKRAGLVVEKPLGTRRIYALHDEGMEAVQGYLERVWGEAAARFRLVASNTTPDRANGRALMRRARDAPMPPDRPIRPTARPPHDRADPPGLRCRLPRRSRLRRLDRANRGLVAEGPYRLGGGGSARRPGASTGRPDLRTPIERPRARLGRGHDLGAAHAARLHVAPESRSKRRDGRRNPVRGPRRRDTRSRSSIAAGSASERTPRPGGIATAAAGPGCCRTTSGRRRSGRP